ncbi:MAG: methyltransferase domain-containing protein [Alsobacter sp.]
MAEAPTLFDRALLRERLDRAVRAPEGHADFLVRRAAEDLGDRLATVLRRFERAVDWGTPGGLAAEAVIRTGQVGCVAHLAPSALAAVRSGPVAVADVEQPPLARESVDLVVSLLALQVVDDLPGALSRIRSALRPDGLFLACLLGGSSLTELRQAFTEAEAEVEGGASPRVAPFADVRDLGGLLQRAGLALPVADSDVVTVRYRDPFGLLRDLRAMGATNALLARRREPLRRATLLRMAEIYAGRFADPDGRVRATFELVWLSGWAPHESQQKPLKPGSARMRLADALKPPGAPD